MVAVSWVAAVPTACKMGWAASAMFQDVPEHGWCCKHGWQVLDGVVEWQLMGNAIPRPSLLLAVSSLLPHDPIHPLLVCALQARLPP